MKIENIRKVGRDERGLSTVEYTILLVLVVAGTVSLWNGFGKDLTKKLSGSTAQFATVPTPKGK